MQRHRILFLAANPVGLPALQLDEEARAIQDEIRRTIGRDRFELVPRLAARPMDLLRALREVKPSVVHFAGHASADGIYLVDERGQPKQVTREALQETFGAAGQSVQVVVLNGCATEQIAKALCDFVPVCFGTSSLIEDTAARTFSMGWYGALASDESAARAFSHGKAAMRLEATGDHDQPRLHHHKDIDPNTFVLTDPDEAPAPRAVPSVAPGSPATPIAGVATGTEHGALSATGTSSPTGKGGGSHPEQAAPEGKAAGIDDVSSETQERRREGSGVGGRAPWWWRWRWLGFLLLGFLGGVYVAGGGPDKDAGPAPPVAQPPGAGGGLDKDAGPAPPVAQPPGAGGGCSRCPDRQNVILLGSGNVLAYLHCRAPKSMDQFKPLILEGGSTIGIDLMVAAFQHGIATDEPNRPGLINLLSNDPNEVGISLKSKNASKNYFYYARLAADRPVLIYYNKAMKSRRDPRRDLASSCNTEEGKVPCIDAAELWEWMYGGPRPDEKKTVQIGIPGTASATRQLVLRLLCEYRRDLAKDQHFQGKPCKLDKDLDKDPNKDPDKDVKKLLSLPEGVQFDMRAKLVNKNDPFFLIGSDYIPAPENELCEKTKDPLPYAWLCKEIDEYDNCVGPIKRSYFAVGKWFNNGGTFVMHPAECAFLRQVGSELKLGKFLLDDKCQSQVTMGAGPLVKLW